MRSPGASVLLSPGSCGGCTTGECGCAGSPRPALTSARQPAPALSDAARGSEDVAADAVAARSAPAAEPAAAAVPACGTPDECLPGRAAGADTAAAPAAPSTPDEESTELSARAPDAAAAPGTPPLSAAGASPASVADRGPGPSGPGAWRASSEEECGVARRRSSEPEATDRARPRRRGSPSKPSALQLLWLWEAVCRAGLEKHLFIIVYHLEGTACFGILTSQQQAFGTMRIRPCAKSLRVAVSSSGHLDADAVLLCSPPMCAKATGITWPMPGRPVAARGCLLSGADALCRQLGQAGGQPHQLGGGPCGVGVSRGCPRGARRAGAGRLRGAGAPAAVAGDAGHRQPRRARTLVRQALICWRARWQRRCAVPAKERRAEQGIVYTLPER